MPEGKGVKPLFFKDKPLVRSGDLLYYGDPSQKYIVKINVLSSAAAGDLELSTKVSVELLDISGKYEKLIKKSERNGLYDALDIGGIWLERAIAESAKA